MSDVYGFRSNKSRAKVVSYENLTVVTLSGCSVSANSTASYSLPNGAYSQQLLSANIVGGDNQEGFSRVSLPAKFYYHYESGYTNRLITIYNPTAELLVGEIILIFLDIS